MPITGNKAERLTRKMWIDTRLRSLIVMEPVGRYSRGAHIRCFHFNPSVKSSLHFLGKTWEREKVKAWFSPKKCPC